MGKLRTFLTPNRVELVGTIILLALGATLSLAILGMEKQMPSSDGHGGEEHHGEEAEGLELSEESIEFGEIVIEEAKPRSLIQKVRLRGRIAAHGDRLLEIKSRFAGTIYSAAKNSGDQVKKGDVLAKIENIASRSSFDVISEITGEVVECNVVRGSFVNEMEHLYTIVDTSLVWVDLNAFLEDIDAIKISQPIEISSTDTTAKGNCKVSYVSPLVDEDTQTFKVRCELVNSAKVWRPGSFVDADVITETTQAKVAIKRDAVQDLDGQSVIFVQKNGRIVSRQVTLGRADDTYIEVTNGLAPDESYVAQNSFTVKAELLKSTAGHDH